MKSSTQITLIVFASIILALVACLPITMLAMPLLSSNPTSTPDTFATIQAMVTQTVAAQTQYAPTQTPLPPTAIPTSTPIPATNTPLPTATAVTYCDWVSFVKDVTVPDGTAFEPGDIFTKTWRLKNRGTCTWTPDYMLVYTSGSQMGGTTAVRLPGYVAPGQTVDVSVTLTAPNTAGKFVGYWMLRNPSGTLFGYGDKANQAFYVEIKVKASDLPHGTVTGDICYPSEFNPPMTLYFEQVGTSQIIQFSIPENYISYSVLLPNGTYYAYAWAPGYNLEGAYVNSDGTLKPFVVQGGQTTSGIRICDWGPDHHSRAQ
ncbi:MAG: NBR1-Ig-like domain-containing protein [Anaerolineales bacterium]